MSPATLVTADDEENRSSQPKAGFSRRTMSRLVKGKNINGTSLLATDYLNHFNEVIMLIEMLPMMPECLEDVMAWSPKSYSDHFRESSFSDKELAILAYDHSPAKYRGPFDLTVSRLNDEIASTVGAVEKILAAGATPDELHETTHRKTMELRQLIDIASTIINGNDQVVHQADVDAILDDGGAE